MKTNAVCWIIDDTNKVRACHLMEGGTNLYTVEYKAKFGETIRAYVGSADVFFSRVAAWYAWRDRQKGYLLRAKQNYEEVLAELSARRNRELSTMLTELARNYACPEDIDEDFEAFRDYVRLLHKVAETSLGVSKDLKKVNKRLEFIDKAVRRAEKEHDLNNREGKSGLDG